MDSFAYAAQCVRSGDFDATNEERLRLYALYKVASEQPVRTDGTGRVAEAKRAAHEAAAAQLAPEPARRAYVQMVTMLMTR